MSKHCLNCYYQHNNMRDGPCGGCVNFNRWVSMNFLDNVDDRPVEKSKEAALTGVMPGVKYDKDKPQWSLLPFKALREVVDVLTYGARKYAPDNWKKVPDAKRRYIDAGFRHFTAYAGGEKLDPETGKSHLAHAMCCLLYLLAFEVGEHHDQSDNDN